MEQLQTDPTAPQPKKHRMTFAEWRQANPNYEPTPEEEEVFKAIEECVHHLLESSTEWFRENQAEERRKNRQVRSKQTQAKPASRKTAKRARTPNI